MPIYEYLCRSCGLKFERTLPMAKSGEKVKCECGTEAEKLLSTFGFAFAHKPVNGPVPQNTGVHSVDYNYDKVIGRDAEQKWKVIEQRDKAKDEAIRDARREGKNVTSRDQLVGTAEGGYRPITEPERVAANQNRVVANEVNKTLSTKGKKP